jgi:hypothetical protein
MGAGDRVVSVLIGWRCGGGTYFSACDRKPADRSAKLAIMILNYLPLLVPLLYLALILLIVWYVISALHRISRGVEDIAQTLRRLESRSRLEPRG